jgi:U1 small nuclear ribonucleoprotein 70kDa
MTCNLPPNLLRLFAPRPPIRFLPAIDTDFPERRHPTYTSLAASLPLIEGHDTDYTPTLSMAERKEQALAAKKQKHEDKQTRMLTEWDPSVHPSEPFKTLFVSNLVFCANLGTSI